MLNFKSLYALFSQLPKFKFQTAQVPDDDILPVLTYECYDNFDLLNVMGTKEYKYDYFDFDSGEQKNQRLSLTDPEGPVSLAEYYSIDEDIEGLSCGTLDRTTEFLDVDGIKLMQKGKYYDRINSLNKIWITTVGNQRILCGDVVTIMPDKVMPYFSNQYAGNWLVERIIHHFANTYTTRLLLTRGGVDAQSDSELMKSNFYRGIKSYKKTPVTV